MIRIEHINLVIKDMKKSLEFYRAAFPHWQVRAEGGYELRGQPKSWIHFGDDYQYLAFSDYGEGENRDLEGEQVGLAHFAFVVNDLDALMKRLSQAGFDVDKDGADEPFRKNIYYIDPDGFEVEFVEYLSDLPTERNLSAEEG